MSTLISPSGRSVAEYDRAVAAPHKRPSAAGYWLAAALALTGVLAAAIWAVFGFVSFTDHIDGFTRVMAPGQTTVSITEPGTYTVYYEHARGATSYDLDVVVTDPTGSPLTLQPVRYDVRYDVPGQSTQVGTAVAQFRADVAGGYGVTVNRDLPGTTVAVGDDLIGYAVPQVVGIGALVLATGAGALALALITAVRRSR